jgi:hypothetical protein
LWSTIVNTCKEGVSMIFNFKRKNIVSPVVLFSDTFLPFRNPAPGRGRRSFFVLLVLAVCILLTSPLAAKEPEKLTVNPTGSASLQDHLTFQQNNPQYGQEPKVVPFMPMSGPREVDSLESPSGPESISASQLKTEYSIPLLPVINGFQALSDPNTRIPPDTMGAAGPNHLMTMLNTDVRIQDKSGTDLGTVTLATWWTSGTGLAGIPFDPRVIFDSLTGRWMAVVDANSGNPTTSATWLAISQTSDPTGTWLYYTFNMETPGNNLLWHDFPDIGTNIHWIAITNNMFSGSSFIGAAMWVIDKTTLGGPLPSYRFPEHFDLTLGTYDGTTLRPALTFDPFEPVLYIVDGNNWVWPSPKALIRLSMINGVPPAAPTWSVVPDAAGPLPGTGWFYSPEVYDTFQVNASQLGTSTRVVTNDARILNAVFRNGHLWFTHSGGRPAGGTVDRTTVSWYEVDPLLLNSQANPTLQSGTLDPGSDGHFFFPSIAVNKNDDAALGFSHSNSSIFVEGVVSGRKGTDPSGIMDSIKVVKAGEDSYVKDFSSGRVRWGDYSATVVDPADDETFWSIQEYAAFDVGINSNDDRWGTWWVELSASPQSSDCGVYRNPITNCGFETGDFTGWVAQDMATPYYPLSVRPKGTIQFLLGSTVNVTPTEGYYSAVNGFDGGGPDTIKLGQDVHLPTRSKELTFDYRAAYEYWGVVARTFTVTIEPAGGGAPLQTTLIYESILPSPVPAIDTGNLTGSVDVSHFGGQSVRISFNWYIPENYTGPGSFQLDNVAVFINPFPWPMFVPALKEKR